MTPESTVYRGLEGTGQAQIFGREGNPFNALQQVVANKRQQDALEFEKQKLAKQERDKKTFDLLNYNPEKTFQPFNDQVLKAAEDTRKWIIEQVSSGKVDPQNPYFQTAIKNRWDQVDDVARRGNYIKDVLTQTREQIAKNPYLDTKYYNDKLNNLYMDAYGNGIPIDQIDVNALGNVHVTDPMGFNAMKYAKDYMKDMKQNTFNYINQQALANGRDQVNDVQIKVMGDLYTPDPADPQGIKRNPDGTPMVNITNDFKNAFLQGETARRYFEERSKMEGRPIEELIKETVMPLSGAEKDVKVSFSSSPQWQYEQMLRAGNGGILPSELPGYTDRHQSIVDIINAFPVDQQGNITSQSTPEARSALGKLVGGKFGDDYVVDVQVVPPTNAPGATTVMGKALANSEQPRLVMKVKRNDTMPEKLVELNLTDERAYDVINSTIETSKAEGGKKYASDDLLRINKATKKDIYQGREALANMQKAGKMSENEMVSKIQKFEDLDKLVGKQYNGKVIKKANKLETDPGIFGFGKKYELELEFEDGTTADVDVKKYDDIASIVRGDSKQQASGDDMVPVTNPKGEPRLIPKSKLEAAIKAGWKKR